MLQGTAASDASAEDNLSVGNDNVVSTDRAVWMSQRSSGGRECDLGLSVKHQPKSSYYCGQYACAGAHKVIRGGHELQICDELLSGIALILSTTSSCQPSSMCLWCTPISSSRCLSGPTSQSLSCVTNMKKVKNALACSSSNSTSFG